MSDDSYRFQISGDIGNGLYVLRGNSVAEVKQMSKDLAAEVAEILDNLSAVKQVTLVKEVFSEKNKGYQKSNNGATAKAVPAATTEKAPDGSYQCEHGKMKFLDYEKKDGSGRVLGHYCQAPRGAKKCAPIK